MSETPYVETEALITLMNGDEDEALRIVDTMLPGERAVFVHQLKRLSLLADDSLRCGGCGKPTDAATSVTTGHLVGPRRWWHPDCLRSAREEAGTS